MELRVFAWQGVRAAAASHPDGRSWSIQTREIVAVTSKAAVARAAPSYVTDPRQLFNLQETGNKREIEVAMGKPGTVFWQPLNSLSSDWVENQ